MAVVADFAFWIACQIANGVAGMVMSRMLYSRNASTMALKITASAGVVPPSPPAFAAGLDAERIGRRENLADLGLERRQRGGARHCVIHERAGERLAG